MLLSWDIDQESAGAAYDFITEHGKRRMDCKSNSSYNQFDFNTS